MEFRILGPLEVFDGQRVLPLGGTKPRALLAVLLLRANEPVSSDRLIEEIWGETPPRSATKLVQGYVSGLRRSLGATIETRPPGYRLRVDEDDFDLLSFVRLADDARQATRENDLERAARLFTEALALWRGTPLADVELHGPAAVEADRLAELRLGAILDRVDVELARGRHAELVGDLEARVGANPLQERLRGQLMLALYRSGRQADALRVYREARELLVEELGLEPSEALRGLEASILRHDPALDVSTAAPIVDRSGKTAPELEQQQLPSRREERRLATILFAEVAIEGFERSRDPESARATHTTALARMEQEVQSHGGVIEHVVGNQVLALFGIPQSHEDDAERAVRAAVSTIEAVGQLSRAGASSVVARFSVEAGEVLVASDGGRRNLAGPAIGTAERLLASARPGCVVVGEGARRATADTVEYRALQMGSEDDQAWEVATLRPAHGADRRPLSLGARLVGRDEELALLQQEIQLLCSERRPRLVTVLGEAGVGKSRLVHELLSDVEAAAPVIVRRGRCLAYGSVSYSALADAVRAECDILADDRPEVMSDKVARTVERHFGDRSVAPHLEALVGTGMAGELSREELFDVWRGLLERIAGIAPLLVVLEDLHWADDGLLDFVDHVADWAEASVLVLCLARPELLERRPTWGGGKRNAASITLEPLTPAETKTLAGELLSTDPPAELASLLVERSEGNPLFGEEIVRMLIEQDVLRERATGGWELVSEPGDVDVPRSVRAVIGARLDTLPLDEVDVVQAAAVVGRIFWVGAVQRLCRRTRRETRELLARLRAREIVLTHADSSFSGEPELAFRHVLIRDVAYESLPKTRRVDAHVEMARWAAEHSAGREEEIAELLATHYWRACGYLDELGEYDDRRDLVQPEAYRWARAAGERAHRLWQQREAARWFRVALDAADGLELGRDKLATLWEAYARAGEGVEPYAEVASAFEQALALYESLGAWRDAGRIESWLAHVASQSSDDEGVLFWAGRALEHLEQLGDSPELALALVHLGWYHHRHGRDVEAEPYVRRAAAIAERVGDRVVHSRAIVSLGMLVSKSGRGEEGMNLLDAGLELARGAGDLSLLLWALLVVSEAHELLTCDYRRAEALVREGLELARRAGNTGQAAWMHGNLADYLVDMGRLDDADEPAREGLEAARVVGDVPRIAYSLLMNAYLRVLRLDLDEAERFLGELRPLIAEGLETYHEGWSELIEGLVARARGDDARATEVFVRGAAERVDRLEPWAGQLLLLECVRSLAPRGRREEAERFREQLSTFAQMASSTHAFLAWADGLLEAEPSTALSRLRDAVTSFERLERRVELGRCLVDVAQAEERSGSDPMPTLAQARQILQDCGATIFLAEVAETETRRA